MLMNMNEAVRIGRMRALVGWLMAVAPIVCRDARAIEPVARVTSQKSDSSDRSDKSDLSVWRLGEEATALDKVRGVHPRIYLNASRIEKLRQAIATTHRPIWEQVRARADELARRKPPAYRAPQEGGDDEQLWQRPVGEAMPTLAMAWLLTGDRRYLEAARQWALASCGYPTWGGGRFDGKDLATGHQLFGLALVYDWCHRDLDEEARRTIRETLVRRAAAIFEAAAKGETYWHKSYLQNHLWVNVCGLAATGFALFDEVEEARLWIGLPLDKFRRTMDALGPDGASHEGVGYWQYGAEYMLKFMDPARELLGVDLYAADWWRNTAMYPQYLALPRHAWTRRNCIVDIADCPRGNWYGPEHILRALAREYRDGHAQWLAREVDAADIEGHTAPWLNLVWFDPSVEPEPPAALPTLRHFEDMGIVAARSDWTGDESLVVFKCGPFIGHEAVQAFAQDPGGGHVHPDANHFVLFGGGEWLIRDDGYRAKWTGQQNSLLVEGRGQLGEGRMWFSGREPLAVKARPRILRAVATPGLDHIAGDAAEAYPRDLGLRRYVRHALFLKPDALIVVDDIALDRARSLELRFHPESAKANRDGEAFLFDGERTRLRFENLTPEGVSLSAGNHPAAGREGEQNETMFAIRLEANREQWRNAAAFSWASRDAEPARVSMRARGDRWVFQAGGRVVEFDWTTGKARQAGP